MQQMNHLKAWLDEISSKLGAIYILQALVYEGGMAKQLGRHLVHASNDHILGCIIYLSNLSFITLLLSIFLIYTY
jgi:hypothetical protein